MNENLSLEAGTIELIRKCLHASAEGNFFDDWEFHPLFGLERTELREILDRWPDVTLSNKYVLNAVVNSINNLIRYPHGLDRELEFFLDGSSKEELEAILDTIRSIK